MAPPLRNFRIKPPRGEAIRRDSVGRTSAGKAGVAAGDWNRAFRNAATLSIRILLGGVMLLVLAVGSLMAFFVLSGVLVL